MEQCDCGAEITGKWAGVHHPSCAALKRRPICHGDAGEGGRLYGLSVGHVLTEQDVADIRNLISDYNDEIGQTSDIHQNVWQRAIVAVEPSKAHLAERIAALETDLMVEKGMTNFLRLEIQRLTGHRTPKDPPSRDYPDRETVA